jgi:NAD(P)-dependent dehydrogenase (short-subunit alcohol dehydrogenase family)
VLPNSNIGALSGRNVVITGGNGGIGLAIANGVSRAGADVTVWARNPRKNRDAIALLEASGTKAHAIVCDVGDQSQIDAAMAATIDRFGRVDALFANAGIGGGSIPFLSISLEDWRSVMKVDLDGAFMSLQAGARQMVEQRTGGALIAVSSIIARFGGTGQAHYGAAKTAVEGLIRSMAVELASKGIRCNTLAPGWTETDMLAPGGSFGASDTERLKEFTIRRTPVGRWAKAEDFSAIAAFLADPTLIFHTGEVMVLDGGYSIS